MKIKFLVFAIGLLSSLAQAKIVKCNYMEGEAIPYVDCVGDNSCNRVYRQGTAHFDEYFSVEIDYKNKQQYIEKQFGDTFIIVKIHSVLGNEGFYYTDLFDKKTYEATRTSGYPDSTGLENFSKRISASMETIKDKDEAGNTKVLLTRITTCRVID